jgi:hypothetical protein
MQAIRQSPDPVRTMDAFWQGQIKSKEWLIDHLVPFISKQVCIDICGGWVGVLPSMLFQSEIPIASIRSIDIDPSCKDIANLMNRAEEIAGRFQAITADMCDIQSSADIIVNTSCEHITQDDYFKWLSKLPEKSLLVLQSNDYKIQEHIRTAASIDEFINQCGINILWSGKLPLQNYTRFMIIGIKQYN